MTQSGGNGGAPGGRAAGAAAHLAELVQKCKVRLRQRTPPSGPRIIMIAVVLVLAGLCAWTAYYTVSSDSVAVVQRFGKYLKVVPPGLHFKLPLGVDLATIVPVKRQLKQEFGFATPGARSYWSSRSPEDIKQLGAAIGGPFIQQRSPNGRP